MHLGGAEDLNAFVGEVFEEAGEGQGGTVDAAFTNQAAESDLADDELHLEFFPVGLEKVGDGDAVDGFLHGEESCELSVER